MSDVIERAREALAHMEAAWEDDDVPLSSDFQAIRDLLAEIDSGYLIDTRRIEALADAHGLAALVNEDPGQTGSDTSDDCAWIVEYGLMGLRGRRETPYCASAGEALAAAEREAQ